MNSKAPQNRFDAARSALALLEQHGIDPEPPHFEVAFFYMIESNLALKQDIDRAIEQQVLTGEYLSELYRKHLQRGMTGEEITDLSNRLQNEIAMIMDELTTTRQGTEAFSENLSESDNQLRGAQNDPAQIRNILEGMLTETQKMSSLTANMDAQLNATQQEVSELRARLVEAEREATTDPLTNLANRKGFEESMKDAIEMSMAGSGNLCLILADVDHFKKFNDTHGHQLGDLVLRMVALSMQNETPEPNVVARFGGEEFAIIMPNTDIDEAVRHADDIRHAIEKRKLVKKGDGQPLGRVTVSFGVAKFDRNKPVDHVIEQADKALYAAKKAGRNTVIPESAL